VKHRSRTLAVLSTLAVCALALVPAVASASSIVFIKDHNVWLANPDGTGQYQVTLNGTAAEPYRSPSQADDGTIFAIKGDGQDATFHKMKQNGQLLAPPFESSAPGTGPLEATISPNGALAAYSFLTITDYSCYPYRCGSIDGQTLYTYSDRFTPYDEIYGPQTYGDDTSWINNGRTVFANGSGTLWTDGVGTEEARQWFSEYFTPGNTYGAEGQSFRDAEVAGQTVALIRQNEGHIDETYPPDGTTSIQLYSFSGTAYSGSDGVTATCFIRKQGTAPLMEDPTLSPDASMVAWQEPDGIWSAPTACTDGKILTRIITGGSEPDWGPANVNPGPRPQLGDGGGGGGGDNGAAPEFSANVKTPSLGKALRRGVPFSVKADEACGIAVLLLYRGKVVARGKGALAAPGKTVVKAKFTRRGKRKLRDKRRAKLKVEIGVSDSDGNFAQASGRLVLKR
jgi:hypothetical protein